MFKTQPVNYQILDAIEYYKYPSLASLELLSKNKQYEASTCSPSTCLASH